MKTPSVRCIVPLSWALLSFLFAATNGPCWAQQLSARQQLEAASSKLNAGNPQEAEIGLRSILARWPSNIEAIGLLAVTLSAEGRDHEAVTYFESVVRMAPRSGPAHQNLAIILARLNRNTLAEEQFRLALQLEPQNASYNHNLGEFYARAGKTKDAATFLQRAQELAPDSFTNGYDLAVLRFDLAMFPEAENLLTALIKLKNDPDCHSLLGQVYEKEGKSLLAAEQLQIAAQMDPSEANLLSWGAELIAHKTPKPALDVFSPAVEAHPESWRLRVALAITRYALGETSLATQLFCQATDLNPQAPEPYFFLSQIEDVPHDMRSAVKERFKRYLDLQPSNSLAHVYYARTLWEGRVKDESQKDTAQIEQLLQQAIHLDARCARAYLELGLLYSRTARLAASVSQYQQALKLDPSLQIARYHLGRSLIQLGKDQLGKQQLAMWRSKHLTDQSESEKMMQFIYSSSIAINNHEAQ